MSCLVKSSAIIFHYSYDVNVIVSHYDHDLNCLDLAALVEYLRSAPCRRRNGSARRHVKVEIETTTLGATMWNMKSHGMVLRATLCGVLYGGIAACSPVTPAVDLTAEKAALLNRDHEWQAAVDQKTDTDKIMSFFAADGVVFGSGEPTRDTREELLKAVSGLTTDPGFHEHWGWSRVELSSDGRLAYLLGTTDRTTTDAGGHVVTSQARVVNVWRKDPDGIWRCVVDVFVDNPTPAK